jgi:hypothetical protein
MRRAFIIFLLLIPAVFSLAAQKHDTDGFFDINSPRDPFATGWFLADTNGDGIADAINGKIIVPDQSTAAENSAAANFAARLAHGSTGLTLPLVIPASAAKKGEMGIRIIVSRPELLDEEQRKLVADLENGEGAILSDNESLIVFANDAVGLAAAADAYSAREPYQWKVPGENISAIGFALLSNHVNGSAVPIALTYLHGEQGIHRATLTTDFPLSEAELTAAFVSGHLAAVRELVVIANGVRISATNPKPLPAALAAPPSIAPNAENPNAAGPEGAGANGNETGGGAGGAAAGAPVKLDLATLYTSRGLFTGSARMPVPSSSDAHLYVPAGAAGIAMANLAARMGMEATGITLPIASPAPDCRRFSLSAGSRKKNARRRYRRCASGGDTRAGRRRIARGGRSIWQARRDFSARR